MTASRRLTGGAVATGAVACAICCAAPVAVAAGAVVAPVAAAGALGLVGVGIVRRHRRKAAVDPPSGVETEV